MSAEEQDKPDLFKNIVIILLTLVGVFAALVTFLQSYASLKAADFSQRSAYTAMNATGHFFDAGLRAGLGTDTLEQYQEFLQRAVRADTKARAARMGGQGDIALEFDADAERWYAAARQVESSDPLLSDFGQDETLYRETLTYDAYLDEERQQVLLDQSRAWNAQANGYVAILSTLSVALFLFGLSLTIESRVRYLLAAAGFGLTTLCTGWMVFVLFTPVPTVSEAAIQRFVEGRIQYNLAQAQGGRYTEAIADFDAAIDMAPDYGRAYFYRSLANTDASLLDKIYDTQKAIDDGRRAIELGHEGSPVYGNLGWLYYLNGQYESALQYTETALEMSPDDCYLPFNRGLILMALGRPGEANGAYDEAIACAQKQASEANLTYYLDAGVIDLERLAIARPDLADNLTPAIQRLKESLAALRMYGVVEPHTTDARFESLQFGTEVDNDDIVQNLGAEFPQKTDIIYAQLAFQNMRPDMRWYTRWKLNGREYYTTYNANWIYTEAGTTWVSLYNLGGLTSGRYTLDVFVEGVLVASGDVNIEAGDLPPMTYYNSTAVEVTLAYPTTWKITALADNEVSVIAARDPYNPTFFGSSAWVATTGTDDDIFGFFDYFTDEMEAKHPDFELETREAFTIAERDGWLAYYTYTDAEGTAIKGAYGGVLTHQNTLVYMVSIEARDDEWDSLVDTFNVMLNRMRINDD